MNMDTKAIGSQFLSDLGLEEVQHRVYENPPLQLVACQIRFSQELSILNPGYVAPFQNAIKSEYPSLTGGDAVTLKLQITDPADARQPSVKTERTQQYIFRDREDNWTVVLTAESVAIETRRYQNFTDFLERLQRILDALIEHINPSTVTRIGLRYINEFRPNGEDIDWSSVLNSQILGVYAIANLKKRINLAVQEIYFRLLDDHQIAIRHGLFPEGTTVQPQEGMEIKEGSFYLLDFDMFKEFSPTNKMAVSIDEICSYIRGYNLTIFHLFHTLVAEEYLATLGAKDE